MGINYNPRGVSEGLIYYIDPYNNRSYSGTGNTVYNLVNASIGGTFVGSTASPIDSTSTRTFYMGGSNYINCPNNIPLTNNFTVSVWFKLNAYNNSSIINKWFADSSPTNHRSWFIGSETSSSSVVVVLSSDGTYTNPTIKRYVVPVNLNEYTNITFTFATGILTVYKNGLLTTVTKSLDASFTTVYDNPTRPIQIGYGYDSGNYYGLANVGITQIYNRVLSPTEILQNYDAVEKRYYPEENIVRDGLILNLDPGNSRSYAGAGNTIYDLSGTGNSGNLINGPAFSPVSNGHFVFDGVNDTIRINNNMLGTLYSKATSYSCDLWVYINSTQNTTANGDNDIVENGGGNYPFVIRYERPLIRTAVYDGVNFPQSNFAFTRDTWIHLTLVVNYATNIAYSYLNGVLASTFSLTAITDTFTSTNLFLFSRDGSLNWTTGKLGPFHMYRKALSAQEVLQNYNSTKNRFINVLPPVRDNLILNLDAGNLASYPGSGTSWFDLSGNGNNSSLVGSPTYTFNDSASFITFDANTKSGTLSTSILNNYSSGTIECSVFITNLTSSFILARQRNGFNSYSVFSIGSYADGGGALVTGTSGIVYYHNKNAQTVLSSSTALLANTWYRLSITFTTSSVILYINGVQNATVAGDYSVPNDASTDPRIGAWIKDGANYPMNGRLAQFQVYNRALSAAEILQNYNATKSRYGY